MIKLTNLLNEIYEEKPEDIDDDILSKGYKLGPQSIDPNTGTVSTDVINIPKLLKIKSELGNLAQSFELFTYSKHKDVSDLAIDIRKTLFDVKRKVSALNGMIELYYPQNQQSK
jgi:hypothetical protein